MIRPRLHAFSLALLVTGLAVALVLGSRPPSAQSASQLPPVHTSFHLSEQGGRVSIGVATNLAPERWHVMRQPLGLPPETALPLAVSETDGFEDTPPAGSAYLYQLFVDGEVVAERAVGIVRQPLLRLVGASARRAVLELELPGKPGQTVVTKLGERVQATALVSGSVEEHVSGWQVEDILLVLQGSVSREVAVLRLGGSEAVPTGIAGSSLRIRRGRLSGVAARPVVGLRHLDGRVLYLRAGESCPWP